MTESRKEILERRKKAKTSHDILGDLAGTIDKAKGEKLPVVGAITERRVEKRIMKESSEAEKKEERRKNDENKKTIRLHPDLRYTLEKYAGEYRPFTEVLREVIMTGLKAKNIEIEKPPVSASPEPSSPADSWL